MYQGDKVEYKSVKVSVETWERLRELGQMGDSFDDVITRLITDQKPGVMPISQPPTSKVTPVKPVPRELSDAELDDIVAQYM